MASFLTVFYPSTVCHKGLKLRKAKSFWISSRFTEEFLILAHYVTIYGYKGNVNDYETLRPKALGLP